MRSLRPARACADGGTRSAPHTGGSAGHAGNPGRRIRTSRPSETLVVPWPGPPGADRPDTRDFHGREPSAGTRASGCTDRSATARSTPVGTKITLIYDNPTDPAAFEAGYPDQLALAQKLPGVQRVESAKVWPTEDGSATPAYRLLDLHF